MDTFAFLQSMSNKTLVKIYDILLAEDTLAGYRLADMVADAYLFRNPSNGIVTAYERAIDDKGNRLEGWWNYCERGKGGLVIRPVA